MFKRSLPPWLPSRRDDRSLRAIRLPLLALAIPALVGTATLLFGTHGARAEGGEADTAEQAERCAIRLAIALQGKSADSTLLASGDPQTEVDALIASPEFAERYARFINAEFNGGPADAREDPVYYLAKHVLSKNKPWSELFVGAYAVTATAPGVAPPAMEVKADANGLGYFRSAAWMKRYAGNEDQGYMLSGAFRILSNTTGLELDASVGNPGDDRSATGRKGSACKGCHFDAWYALDKFARLLPKKKGQGDTLAFLPPTDGPQKLLGTTLATDKDLVTSLVDSDAWRFSQCRSVFKFLYGRRENQCEANVFDACVESLSSKKTLASAVAAVAKDPSFCVK